MYKPMRRFHLSQRFLVAIAWVCVVPLLAFYSWKLVRIGTDLRQDFWIFWQNNRVLEDPDSALQNGKRILREASKQERIDRQQLTPAELQQQADQTAAGNPPPTIAQPGPGLFDTPRDLQTVWHRWQRLKPVYGHIFRGWVLTYDNLVRDRVDGDYQMDYPPLRSLAMTLWSWKIETQFPGLYEVPRQPVMVFNPRTRKKQAASPEIVQPLLLCNQTAEGISAIAIFFLVLVWSVRENRSPLLDPTLRDRWGDPLLLIAPLLLGVFTLLRPYASFTMPAPDPGTSLIDMRIVRLSWWIFLVLRYTSAVALARFLPRPFRGAVCAVVAATMAWINPATILDSFGWPQWEAWLLPFFLIAAVFVSLNWWLAAGIVLGIGGMFKGQLFFLAPVLVLCPLFAGWIGRFLRILTGVACGAGFILWPWLVNSPRTVPYIVAAVFAGLLICGISLFRLPVWRQIRRTSHFAGHWVRSKYKPDRVAPPVSQMTATMHWLLWPAIMLTLIVAAILSLLIYKSQDPSLHKYTIAFAAAILLVPWFIPRRMLAAWLATIFAFSLWLSAFSLNGSFSWWQVGFVYGTQRHQNMQLGTESLSNLSSLLERRYNWNLHDSVGSLQLSFTNTPIDLDIQSALATLFAIGILICSVAAGRTSAATTKNS